MTRILLVSATDFEIEPTLRFLNKRQSLKKNTYLLEQLQLTVCITGAGMVNTAFQLGQFKGDDIDLAVNVGVAGSFGKFPIGSVLNVTNDCFSELGAEDGDAFLSIDDLGFGKQNVSIQKPFSSGTLNKLPEASAITVNTVHGNAATIADVQRRYACDLESMEGAAFIQAANAFGWPALQLRSVSNLVERRNKDNWNLPLAIEQLNKVLLDLIHELTT